MNNRQCGPFLSRALMPFTKSNKLTFHYSQCIVVISIPNKGISVKVNCVHLPRGTAHKMPRHVITFAHAKTWQIAVHISIDVSHLIAGFESGITFKIKKAITLRQKIMLMII